MICLLHFFPSPVQTVSNKTKGQEKKNKKIKKRDVGKERDGKEEMKG